MKALKYILLLLLIVIIAVAIYAAMQPSEYDVNRSRIIEAPQQVTYNHIADYKNWEAWSPWLEEDPGMTLEYPEKTSGVGGGYSWTGKDGSGKMETIEADPYSSLEQRITFEGFDPSTVYWDLEPAENGTKVTWGMRGDQNFMFKLYTLFMGNMDEMVGPMYERGLEKLDSILVKDIQKYSIEINGVTNHGGGYYVYKSTSTKTSEVAESMANLMPQVGKFAATNNITAAGPPFIIYHKWDEENNATIFSACYPTTDRVITTENSDVLTGELKPFRALKTTLTGNYSNLKEAWEKAMEYLKKNELKEDMDGSYLEVYTTDPSQYPNPSDWVTEIYIPLQAE
ncbi:SRPBCC family protein [Flavobacteriaceae bacterium M23B6Z8]